MTDNGNKPWQVLGKRVLYTSSWINLAQWSVRLPDGSIIPDHHVLDYQFEAVGVVQVFHAFIAHGLSRQSDPLDVNETLSLGWFTTDEVRGMIARNEITDGLTLTALCWALTVGLD